MPQKTEFAVFVGGCFWCTEAVFDELRGVLSVMPGYAGGGVKNPTYKQVCTGGTGHVEVIRIEFDPSQITFKDFLTVFFATHDPTPLNRQGNDVGTQYGSTVLYANDEQKWEAEAYIKEMNDSSSLGRPVATTSSRWAISTKPRSTTGNTLRTIPSSPIAGTRSRRNSKSCVNSSASG